MHRRGRTVLTGLGVAFGVGILFATLIANATTSASLKTLITDFTGTADLWVTAPGFEKFRESAAQEVGRLPDVETLDPHLGVPATVAGSSEAVTLVGTDLDADRRIYTYRVAAGHVPTPGRREVLLPGEMADDLGVAVGARIRVTTGERHSAWTVAGILRNQGVARSYDGRFAAAWLDEVQSATGHTGEIDNLVVRLRPGTDPARWRARFGNALPEGLTAQEPGAVGAGFERVLSATQTSFIAVSAIAVFVSVFLVYNSLAMSQAERVREYGTLRALGATRRQIFAVVLSEAVVLAVVFTALGLGIGLALSRVLIGLMGDIFRGDVALDTFTVPRSGVITGVAVGIGVTLVAAVLPAARAGRLEPVSAIRNTAALSADRRVGRAWIAGAVLLGLGWALGTRQLRPPLGQLVLLLPLAGAVLLVPLVLRPAGRLVGSLTRPLAPGVGAIAVNHLTKERSRSSLTLGVLMVVLATILTIGAINVSMGRSIVTSISREFGADFVVRRGPDDFDELEAGLVRRVRTLPEVDVWSPVTFHTAEVGGEPVFVDGIDPDTYLRVQSWTFSQGTKDAAVRGMQHGGIVLTTSSARIADAGLGGTVPVRTRKGIREFRVVGVIRTANTAAVAYVTERVATRIWGTREPSMIALNLSSDISTQRGEALLDRELQRWPHFVLSAGELKESVRREFDGFFAPFYAILACSVIVGLLGIVNTLAMAVVHRFREFGVLRAIGVSRGQVRRMVLVESLTMGGVAFLLSIPLGAWVSTQSLSGVSTWTGLEAPWQFPLTWALYAGLLATVIGAVGAYAPGRRAARLEIVSALAYE